MSESRLTVESLVSSISDLPSLPQAALRVIELTDNSASTALTIASVLAQDQALAVKVLRLANSAYYGLSRKVSTLQDAVVVLGMRTVRNLALVASSYPWMVKPVAGYDLGPKQLFCHSFGVATGAQLVARYCRFANPDEAFTAGLMCDIGKIAMSSCLEGSVHRIVEAAQNFCLSFDLAERQLFGFDHAEVGEYLARSWNFPAQAIEAIRYHHAPQTIQKWNPIVDCVHVGDYLTSIMGFGLGADGMQYIFDDSTLERLSMKAEDLDQVVNEFVEQYEAYERNFEELQAA